MDQCGGKTNDLLGLIRKWNDDHADPQQLPVSCYCFQTNQNEWNIFASHMSSSKNNHMLGKCNYKMEGCLILDNSHSPVTASKLFQNVLKVFASPQSSSYSKNLCPFFLIWTALGEIAVHHCDGWASIPPNRWNLHQIFGHIKTFWKQHW